MHNDELFQVNVETDNITMHMNFKYLIYLEYTKKSYRKSGICYTIRFPLKLQYFKIQKIYIGVS